MNEQQVTADNDTSDRGFEVAQLLAAVEAEWPRLRARGIGGDRDSLISVAAVGLVVQVWRNSPVEDAHASRRGPSDGEMMAESLHLHAVARGFLEGNATFPFLDFERHLLDLDRPWAGTSRTVKSMLFGHLGRFRQHVKCSVNGLMAIDRAAGREAVLRVICVAMPSGDRHFGTPGWDQVVDVAVSRLSCPGDPCWGEGGYERAIVRLPSRFVEQPAEFGAVLRRDPGSFGPEVLDDLIGSGLFL